MKYKTDPVTNSSSYSYVCFGMELEGEKASEIYKKLYEDKPELETNIIESFGEEAAIGASIRNMKDFETLKEFKQRICNEIKERTGITVLPYEIQYIEYFSDSD